MDLFTYLMAKKGQNTGRDLFSYLLGKNAGGSGTYTTFSGTSLNISDSLRARIKNFMLNSTELTQDGTPTPDNPVDVNVIKGESNVKVENKNLFQPSPNGDLRGLTITYDEEGVITINGTTSRGGSVNLTENIPLLANTKYTLSSSYISGSYSGSGNPGLLYYNSQTSSWLFNTSVGSSQTKEYTQDLNSKFSYYSSGAGLVFDNYKFKVQLEKNSTATEYVPHQEQNYPINLGTLEYCKIGDYEDKFIRTSGKNLAYTGWAEDYVSRINDSTKAKLEIVDGRNCLNYSARAGYREYDTKYMFKTNWKENTRYTISFDVYTTSIDANFAITYTDGTSSYIENVGTNSWKHYKITSTANKTINYLRARYSSGSTYIDLDTFMINEGTTALDYEPYGSNEWYIKKNIGKVVLDGSESGWTNAGGNAPYKYTNSNIIMSSSENDTNLLSNYYPCKKWSDSWSSFDYMVVQTRNGQSIQFRNVDISTLEDFKTWLSTNKPIVYYPLATPTYIQISQTDYPTLHTQLENIYNNSKSYDGQTNISQTNDDLPFNISVDVKIKEE